MKQLLRHWYWQKFVQNRSTAELMGGACDVRNKQALGIVALLDVDPQLIDQVMDKGKLPFVQSCHTYLRSSEFQRSLGRDA
ncbi:hypothetical protein BKP64_00640 [Marinobacter salinus]|uniref:Uncharacterized protein n=2 Tax=Pseudomonadota TaxID=1224 RepID=A0A1D9GR45_9GAMM|nr:hypothetical protein BKP64_00640 [Marinobacter salinus]